MSRTVDKLYDTTSTSGGALDTGTLNTTPYDSLILSAVAAGAAAPTGYVVYLRADDTAATQVLVKTLTAPGIGATTAECLAVGGTINCAVPDFTQVTITGGASSTVRLIVHGVRTAVGAN